VLNEAQRQLYLFFHISLFQILFILLHIPLMTGVKHVVSADWIFVITYVYTHVHISETLNFYSVSIRLIA